MADGEHDRALDAGVHLLAGAADVALDEEQQEDRDEHAEERVAGGSRRLEGRSGVAGAFVVGIGLEIL